MKALTEYSKNGYDFQIVERIGNCAIAHGKSRISKAESWEVIEIQSHNGLSIAGVEIPPAEFAPRNEQWGVKGWTAINKQHAQELFTNKTNL